MCGIYGCLATDGDLENGGSLLAAMASQTVHRGPDDEGRFLDRKVALGMRRLSIIDVSGGHQPISNEDQSVWVVCNGEIYNFRELRDDLLRRGHIFSSGSDTEVLVHLYEEFGDQFVERLRGMFAFALWDCRRRRLLLARDRLGIKPLYYHTSSGRFVFASEAKAILGIPGFTASLDPDALSEYLALGYVPAPLSMFEGIRKLLPGTLMVRESGRDVVQPYWNLSGDPVEGDSSYTEEEWAGLLREVLDRSVESQMVSDVPLGAFLSGGVDSSAVVGLMAQHSSQPVRTYSIGFETQGAGLLYNELPYARAVAQRFGTKHREIVVRPDVVSLLPKLIWHLDEPVADSAFVTTFLVSEFARKEVTVILSGVGGDELFGGYRRYLGGYYGRYYRMIPAFIRRGLIAPMASRLPSDRHSRWLNLARYARSFLMSSELPLEHRYRRYVEVLGNADLNSLLLDRHREPFDALGRAFDRFGGGDELDTLLRIDLATQLPDDLLMLTDRMSMATSLECRVPLLDESLLDLAMRIPSSIRVRGRNLKYIFKKSLEDLLPAEILYREKRGFGAPVGSWIKQELSSMLERVLSRESIQRRGLMSWEAVDRMIRLHRANREDYTDSLLALLNLELWCRLYIDNESAGGIAEELAAEVA